MEKVGGYILARINTPGYFLKDIDTLYEIDFSKLNEIPPLGLSGNLLEMDYCGNFNSRTHKRTYFIFNKWYRWPIFLTMDGSFM